MYVCILTLYLKQFLYYQDEKKNLKKDKVERYSFVNNIYFQNFVYHQSTLEIDNYSPKQTFLKSKHSHPISKNHITYLKIYKSRKMNKIYNFSTQNPTKT